MTGPFFVVVLYNICREKRIEYESSGNLLLVLISNSKTSISLLSLLKVRVCHSLRGNPSQQTEVAAQKGADFLFSPAFVLLTVWIS